MDWIFGADALSCRTVSRRLISAGVDGWARVNLDGECQCAHGIGDAIPLDPVRLRRHLALEPRVCLPDDAPCNLTVLCLGRGWSRLGLRGSHVSAGRTKRWFAGLVHIDTSPQSLAHSPTNSMMGGYTASRSRSSTRLGRVRRHRWPALSLDGPAICLTATLPALRQPLLPSADEQRPARWVAKPGADGNAHRCAPIPSGIGAALGVHAPSREPAFHALPPARTRPR